MGVYDKESVIINNWVLLQLFPLSDVLHQKKISLSQSLSVNGPYNWNGTPATQKNRYSVNEKQLHIEHYSTLSRMNSFPLSRPQLPEFDREFKVTERSLRLVSALGMVPHGGVNQVLHTELDKHLRVLPTPCNDISDRHTCLFLKCKKFQFDTS